MRSPYVKAAMAGLVVAALVGADLMVALGI